jgi:tRNA(Ile)-lysidine synthase
MPTSAANLLTDFLDKLRQALGAHPPRRRYLIGISGGRDSMALLAGLHSLGYHKLVICHLNHALRGTSANSDRSLVAETAIRLACPIDAGK